MTEADALIRARALLEEPSRRRPGAMTALALSVVLAGLGVGAAATVMFGPPAALQIASR